MNLKGGRDKKTGKGINQTPYKVKGILRVRSAFQRKQAKRVTQKKTRKVYTYGRESPVENLRLIFTDQ